MDNSLFGLRLTPGNLFLAAGFVLFPQLLCAESYNASYKTAMIREFVGSAALKPWTGGHVVTFGFDRSYSISGGVSGSIVMDFPSETTFTVGSNGVAVSSNPIKITITSTFRNTSTSENPKIEVINSIDSSPCRVTTPATPGNGKAELPLNASGECVNPVGGVSSTAAGFGVDINIWINDGHESGHFHYGVYPEYSLDVPGDRRDQTILRPTDRPVPASGQNFVWELGGHSLCQCIFGSDAEFAEFEIPITRYLAPVDSDGKLVGLDDLVWAGVVAPKAVLRIMAWDVDSVAGSSAVEPELDQVLVDGHYVGNLKGANGKWTVSQMEVPPGY
ncbi:MAG: hypothetical protein NTY38_18580, partial [Acidobacteria bacterium]|nr:hypothetical protein [Acidobacteriota bacterium]